MKKYFLLPLAILFIFICLTSCQQKNISPQDAVQELADSVKYDSQNGILSFTTPNKLPDSYALYIHVSGRLKMDDGAMSFHAFEDEEINNSWELGKMYTYEVGKDVLIEGIIDAGLIEKGSDEIQYNKSVNIDEDGVITIISD